MLDHGMKISYTGSFPWLCHLGWFSLVPAILLTKSNETAAGDDPINTSQYISDFTEILIESTSDGEIGK